MELLRLIRQSMPSEHCNEGGGVGEGSNETHLGHNRHDLGSDAYFHIILLLLLFAVYVRHLSVCTHLHKFLVQISTTVKNNKLKQPRRKVYLLVVDTTNNNTQFDSLMKSISLIYST